MNNTRNCSKCGNPLEYTNNGPECHPCEDRKLIRQPLTSIKPEYLMSIGGGSLLFRVDATVDILHGVDNVGELLANPDDFEIEFTVRKKEEKDAER